MMKENKNTLMLVLLVAGIMAFTIIASVSFAYFTSNIEEGEIYSLKGKAKSGGYNISFTESNEGVRLENTYPMLDSMGLQLDPYTFTVKNEETSQRVNVSVIVEVLGASDLDDNLVNIAVENEIVTLSSSISVTPSESVFKSAYKVFDFVLEPSESRTYNLRTWINENGTVSNAQNKTWASRVLIVPSGVPTDATLRVLGITSNGVRTSFDDPATTDEGVFEMEDDYGTSYYYRGAVTNNYVQFAGFYWRIIRINGDGSLRIVYDGTQAYANGANSSERFIGTGAYNTNYNDAKYLGYMYGPAGTTASTSAAQAQTNTADSTIKTYIDAWYKTNIVDAGYGSAVADEIFCNDRSTPGSAATGWSSDTGLGYGTSATAFGAYARAGVQSVNYTNVNPTFKCAQKNDAFTVSDTVKGNGALTYPVGLITADEIVAAGSGKYNTANTSYYLYRPSNWWWSLSPSYKDTNGYAYVFGVYTSGSLDYYFVDYAGAFAPVISLSAEYVSTLRGSGTTADPYTAA